MKHLVEKLPVGTKFYLYHTRSDSFRSCQCRFIKGIGNSYECVEKCPCRAKWEIGQVWPIVTEFYGYTFPFEEAMSRIEEEK